MKNSVWRAMATVAVLAAFSASAAPSRAQTAEVKEKPPMYTYESNWTIPRARWGDVQKDNAASNQKILAPALADGTLIAYGDDENLVHTPDGLTHDNWWQAYSMAGLMKVLDNFYKAGTPTSGAILSATKHWDGVYISRFYNWRAGSWKGAYGHAGVYSLKADAPVNAIETLSKNLFVPIMEKLLADGAIVEYEIDQEAIHTQAPNQFTIYYLAPSAEGLDKVNAAVREAVMGSPLSAPALGSMIDFTAHRDELLRANAVYK
jgi:hypothetical protein